MRDAPSTKWRGDFVCAILSIVLLAASTPAFADDAIHGRIALEDIGSFARADSLNAALDERDANDMLGNLRLTWEPSWDSFSLSVHYLASADYGGTARLERDERALLPEPPTTWFDLTDVFANQGEVTASQTIDRLSLAYTTPDFVVRVGRQALTWGGGLVFRPMDLFDPFSPTATDTEYKPGTDMAYLQWLFADGSDLQLIVVPRPPVKDRAPSANASSVALHFRTTLAGLDATFLVARDHGDWTSAVELSGPLSGATWDVELVPTILKTGGTRVSALANISDATTLLDRNATLFAEYFHNGFGVTGETSLASLPPDLTARLARGQLFNIRANYLAAGLSLEWTPLLTLAPTLIAGLDDRSFYALFAGTYSLADNLTLIAGVEVPEGPAGSEFGGLQLAPASPVLLSPSPQIYLQLRRYF